jgi:hypothetical protein
MRIVWVEIAGGTWGWGQETEDVTWKNTAIFNLPQDIGSNYLRSAHVVPFLPDLGEYFQFLLAAMHRYEVQLYTAVKHTCTYTFEKITYI